MGRGWPPCGAPATMAAVGCRPEWMRPVARREAPLRFADAPGENRRRVAPERAGQCGAKVVPGDPDVRQPLVPAVQETREDEARLACDKDLADRALGGGDGIADRGENPGARPGYGGD